MADNMLMDAVKFNEKELVPVIVQQYDSGEVLMMAWMNRQALEQTLEQGEMCYWSRSRNTLWKKGETSGQTQQCKELCLDCDGDTLLAKVDQQGVACHMGTRSCFNRSIQNGELCNNQDVIISPEELYNPS